MLRASVLLLLLLPFAHANSCANEVTIAVGSLTKISWLRGAKGNGVTLVKLQKGKLRTDTVIPRSVTGENPNYCDHTKGALYCANALGRIVRISNVNDRKYVSHSENTGSSSAVHVQVIKRCKNWCKNTKTIIERFAVAHSGGEGMVVSYIRYPWQRQFRKYIYKIPASAASNSGHSRQKQPRPHQVLQISPRQLLVPDLGSDRAWRFLLFGNGKLHLLDSVKVQSGDGPRHAVLNDKTSDIYMLNELSNSIVRLRVNGCGGKGLKECQRVDLITDGRDTKDVKSAAIRLSRDGRFLYASVRYPGKNGQIVGYAIKSDGSIGWKIGEWDTQGVMPQDFGLIEGVKNAAGACVSYLASANRDSNNLVLREVSPTSGKVRTNVPSSTLYVGTPLSVLQIPSTRL